MKTPFKIPSMAELQNQYAWNYDTDECERLVEYVSGMYVEAVMKALSEGRVADYVMLINSFTNQSEFIQALWDHAEMLAEDEDGGDDDDPEREDLPEEEEPEEEETPRFRVYGG